MITLRGGDVYVRRTVAERHWQSVAREVGGTSIERLALREGCGLLSSWLWIDGRIEPPLGEVKLKGT
jgi:hypothetical protein